jgi:hypothetical protein
MQGPCATQSSLLPATLVGELIVLPMGIARPPLSHAWEATSPRSVTTAA